MITNKDGLLELLESQINLLMGKSEVNRTRLHDEIPNNDRDRNAYERDYSRIMYSNSFRRLQGKMQLMPVEPNKFNRNRLTHSLEVSQIARSIAAEINKAYSMVQKQCNENNVIYCNDDMYVLEAGAFAHDIGNPPFGHKGEKVLNELMKEYGGYEGNAQSLRILMNVEKKFPNFKGLNLTIRTLLSIMKYNVMNNGRAKKFLYKEEYIELMNKLEILGLSAVPRTLDAQIIDAADEIAYCAHDLEDALAQKYFTIDEFIFELDSDSKSINQKYKYDDQIHLFRDWVDTARQYAANASVYGSSEEYAFVFRKELTSILVNQLIKDLDVLSVTEDLKDDFISITGTQRKNELAFRHWKLVRGIKRCTFGCINRSSDIQIYEKLGAKIITGLFEALIDEEFNRDMLLMPAEYRNAKNDDISSRYRKVADYIGGMMDTYAIDAYIKIYGNGEIQRLYMQDR